MLKYISPLPGEIQTNRIEVEMSPGIDDKRKERELILKSTAAGKTDRGRKRELNEDNFSINEDIGLFVVTDGIGGLNAGEKASEIVATVLPMKVREALQENDPDNIEALGDILSDSISYISKQIHKYSSENNIKKGAGATVVAAIVRGDQVVIAHMGDSRAYLMRGDEIELLTLDHSIVAMLLITGQITKKEAEMHPARHTITRYVGMPGKQKPDITIKKLQDGDRILLCTDGLTGMVEDSEIAWFLSDEEDDVEILSEEHDLDRVCQRLVDAANEAGGRDNITAVVIQMESPH